MRHLAYQPEIGEAERKYKYLEMDTRGSGEDDGS